MTDVLNKEGLRQIIRDTVGLQDGSVVWALDPEPFVSDTDRERIVLEVFSIHGEGWDEKRREYGPPGYPPNAYVTTLRGNRTIIITVRAETFDKGVSSAELLDRLRSRIIDDVPNMQLDAIRLALSDISPSTMVRYFVDERVVNACTADFTFLGVSEQVTAVIPDGQVLDINPPTPDGTPIGPTERGGYISEINDGNPPTPELSD